MSQKKQRPLTPNQRYAAGLLAKGLTISLTAHYAKVRRETVSRWKRDPRIQAEIEARRQELHDIAMERLPQLFDATILALSDQLSGGKRQAYVALGMLKIFGSERILKQVEIHPPQISGEIITNP